MGGGRAGCLLSYSFLSHSLFLSLWVRRKVSERTESYCTSDVLSLPPTHPHTHKHTLTQTAPPSCHSFQLYFLCLSITGSTHANHSIFVPGFLSVHHFSPLCLYNTLSFTQKFYGRSVSVPATSHLSHICRDTSKGAYLE